jgi:ABC-type phosphate/phosphonate transport system substrate-binding protein
VGTKTVGIGILTYDETVRMPQGLRPAEGIRAMSATRCLSVAVLAVSAILPASVLGRSAGAEEVAGTNPVRIGVVGSLFRDTPEPLVQAVMKPLKSLLDSQTGINGKMVAGGDALTLGNQLADDKVQLAVFHGFEFAWVHQKHAELKPLIVAVSSPSCAKVNVIVHKDCPAKKIADLKGLKLVVAQHTREHCHLFLERSCPESPTKFFVEVSTPADYEDALDAIVDGASDATVIDGGCLDTYARRKPGRFAKLKTLVQSESFPWAVVACNPANFNDAAQKRFREGIISVAQTSKGENLLAVCRITSFENVPESYEKDLKAIAKAYPAPEPRK